MTDVRAAVMTAPGAIEMKRFPMPDPEPGAVLMRVRYSGICGTDKHTWRGETVQYAGTAHERRIEYPLICGHENVGVVEATGGEVLAHDGRPLRPGDRDVVHDCSGIPQPFANALRMVRPGGGVVESSAFVDLGPVEINPNRDICTTNVTVVGIGGERATSYAPSLKLVARNLDCLPIERIVTHRLPLERAAEALEVAQRDGAMKVVLDPRL